MTVCNAQAEMLCLTPRRLVRSEYHSCYRVEDVAISEITASPQLGGFVRYPTGVSVRTVPWYSD